MPTSPPPRPSQTLLLILLSGPSGTGISTLAYELCHRLRQPLSSPRRRPHAHIDADNLDAIYPKPTGLEVMLKGLEALWGVLWRNVLRNAELGDGDGDSSDGKQKWGQGMRKKVLIVSGTAVVLEAEGVRRAVDDVVGREVEVEVVGLVLKAEVVVVEGRLRGWVLGEELAMHLESSRRMRGLLEEWCQVGESPDGMVVHRVRSDRALEAVTEEVLGLCGL